MKIAVSRYQMEPLEGSQRAVRHGALLRVSFRDGSTGYADCHPWHEWGDTPLDLQLELLACGHITPLVSRSLVAARTDAEARKYQRHLFHNLVVPPSHQHFSDFVHRHQFDFDKYLENKQVPIKIKVGVDPKLEIAILNHWSKEIASSECLLRLDFNSRLPEKGFVEFLDSIKAVRDHIEFYEDPFPFDPQGWQRLREEESIALAADRESFAALEYPLSCDYLVVKPAVQEIYPFLGSQRKNRRLIITSYLDHPIGQLSAAYLAAVTSKRDGTILDVCGLLTHQAYKQCEFSRELKQEGPRLVPHHEGSGWGYDDLLKGLKWRPLM